MTPMQWALYGSTLFESIALAHRIALFYTMPLPAYGILVSILSILHLANHIADFGATNSIPPLLPYFSNNKQHFKAMMLSRTILPHLPIAVGISVITLMYINSMLPEQFNVIPPALWASLIITETIGAFLRQFLYTVQDVKAIVMIDFGVFCTRICMLWLLFFCWSVQLTPRLILYSHLISTVVYIVLTLWRTKLFFHTLPDTTAPLNLPSQKSMLATKLSNYSLRLSRNIFTANFLTPFFALHFGLNSAGIFYFASKLAHFFVSVMKITIGYTGNGLLAASKAISPDQPKKVFSMLCDKLVGMSLPLVMLFLMTSPLIGFYWYGQAVSQKIIILSVLFLILSVSECFFILYECFYIIQHAASQLFVIKVAELAALYCLMHGTLSTSPATVLCGTIGIRLTTFSMIALLAHRQWKIAPTITHHIRHIPRLAGLATSCIAAHYFFLR